MDVKPILDMSKEDLQKLIMSLKETLLDEKSLKERAKGTLQAFDENENGVLELSEFATLMTEVYATVGKGIISQIDILNIFKETDLNHDNTVDKDEFFILWRKITKMIIFEMEAQIPKLP